MIAVALRQCYALIIGHWRRWLPAVPLAMLLYAGWAGAPVWWYADLLAVFVIAALVCDPFALISAALAPGTRGCIVVAVLLVLAAAQIQWIELYCRVCLVLIATLLAIICWKKNRDWLTSWQVRQSPHVDKVLAQLSHGGTLEAAETWERYGCRETRALLHQALNLEIPETHVNGSHKAAYLLGYLHGRQENERTEKKLQRTVAEKDEVITAQRTRLYQLEDQQGKLDEARRDLQDAKKQIEALRYRNDRLNGQLQEAMRNLDALSPAAVDEPEDRDAAVLAYYEAGHSYAEAGAQFGLSKSWAAAAVKRARQRVREIEA